jgi:hypothetical protein
MFSRVKYDSGLGYKLCQPRPKIIKLNVQLANHCLGLAWIETSYKPWLETLGGPPAHSPSLSISTVSLRLLLLLFKQYCSLTTQAKLLLLVVLIDGWWQLNSIVDGQGWGAAQYSVLGMTIGPTLVSPGTKSYFLLDYKGYCFVLSIEVAYSSWCIRACCWTCWLGGEYRQVQCSDKIL